MKGKRTLANRCSSKSCLSGSAWVSSLGILVLLTPIYWPLQKASYDLPFVVRSHIGIDEAAIIAMDDVSQVELAQISNDRWDRALHGLLIERLIPLRPRAIVFDVWFFGRTTNDSHLWNAIAKATNSGIPVILAGATLRESVSRYVDGWRTVPPFQDLEASPTYDTPVESELFWGVVQAGDKGEISRKLFEGSDSRPTLVRILAQLTDTEHTPRSAKPQWLNYYGPSGHIPYYSYHRVLETTNFFPATEFADTVLFVGSTAGIGSPTDEGTDLFDTPWTWLNKDQMPGVELVATAYINIRRGDLLTQLQPWAEFWLTVGFGALVGGGLALMRPFLALATGFVVAVAVVWLSCLAVWNLHLWFSWMILVVIQVPVAVLWSMMVAPRRLPPVRELPQTQESTLRLDDVERASLVLSKGLEIPDYTLLKRVGNGSYGEVWLAQSVVGTFHAVKFVFRSKFKTSQPFDREFRGVQKFMPISRSHPGFVHLLHVGINHAQQFFFYVMELGDDEVSGQEIDVNAYAPKNLAKMIQRHARLSVESCLALGIELASALDCLHRHGLIHRDIKPPNIIFVHGAAKFADLGLVTDMSMEAGIVTNLGTVGYLPPEGPGAPTADIFSLGKVLYEASTGLSLDEFPNLPSTLLDHPDQAAIRLNHLIVKACEYEPGKRFQTAVEFRVALEEVLDFLRGSVN